MDKLTPLSIETKIDEYMARHSGFEERRDYLSISHIADCPRKVAREYREGFAVEAQTHRMCFAGYEMERAVRAILLGTNVAFSPLDGGEVVATFDRRLRGHLDAVTGEGDIVEIKSVSKRQFEKVAEKGRVLWSHFVQCQLYLRYSGKKQAFVVYRCRDSYEHKVLLVPYREKMALEFEERARKILAAIDEGVLPACECGKCGEG